MDARHHPRVLTDHQVTLDALGRHFPVVTFDLLTGACTFEASERAVIPALPSTRRQEASATVVWATGQYGRMEFCDELDSDIAEAYGVRAGTDAFNAISPRYRFGHLRPALTKYFA